MKRTTSCAAYGAALGFMSVCDASVVIHGSRSCQAMMFASKSVREVGKHRFIPNMGCFECRNMCCTDITEKASIFGGEALLEKKMDDLYSSGRRNIFVTTTCTAGIIGDKCKEVTDRFHSHHPGCNVGCVETSGNMTGDWEEGFVKSSEVLSRFIQEDVEQDDSVNILAERYYFYFRKNIDNYIMDILKDFELKVNTRYLYRSTMNEITKMGSARCNIMTIDDYISDRSIAHVNSRFKAKTLAAPIGFEQYEQWAKDMCNIFDARESLNETLESNSRLRDKLIPELQRITEGKRVLIYHKDTDRFDWEIEALIELGMEIEVIAKKPNHGNILSKKWNLKVHQAEESDSFETIHNEFSPNIIVTDTNLGLAKTRQYPPSGSRLVSERNDLTFTTPMLKQFFPGVGTKGYIDFMRDVETLLKGKGCGLWRSDRL